MKTSDDLSAGTDADVMISIFGTNGTLTDLPLKKSLTNKNAFEQNFLDRFILYDKSIGKINKINIGHNGTKPGSSWKLDYVQIFVEKDLYKFEANKWLENPQSRIDLEPKTKQLSKYIFTNQINSITFDKNKILNLQ